MRSLNGSTASFNSLTFSSLFILSATVLIAAGILFLLDMMEPKWQVFLLFAYSAGIVFFALPKKKLLTVCILFFLMPVNLNFHPIYMSPIIFRPVSGLVIGLRDLPFLVLTAFWLADLRRNGWRMKVINPVTVLLACAIGWITLSMLANDLSKSIALFQLVQMLKCLAAVIVLPHFLKERKTILIIVALLMLAIGIQTIIGGLQFVSGSTLGLGMFGEGEQGFRQMRAGAGFVNRVGGTIGSNNKLAVFLGLLLPIGIAALFAKIDFKYKLFCVLPFIVCGAALDLLTFSRGGWVSLFAGSLIVICGTLMKRTGRIVLPFVAVFLFLTVASATVVAFSESVRMRLLGDDYGSAFTRVPQAIVAMRMIKDNPLLGTGLGMFVPNAFQFDNTRYAITYRFPMPMHNEMLLIASESGLPALFLFLTIFILLLYRLGGTAIWSQDSLLPFMAIGLAGSFVTWFLHNLIEFTYIFMSINFWSLAAMALAVIESHKEAGAGNALSV